VFLVLGGGSRETLLRANTAAQKGGGGGNGRESVAAKGKEGGKKECVVGKQGHWQELLYNKGGCLGFFLKGGSQEGAAPPSGGNKLRNVCVTEIKQQQDEGKRCNHI